MDSYNSSTQKLLRGKNKAVEGGKKQVSGGKRLETEINKTWRHEENMQNQV